MNKITLTKIFLATAMAGGVALSASAQTLQVSIGIRETGGSGPAFSNAGSTGGIEWVNLDGQTLTLDGTWQLFTFTPSVDTLSAFAGATANGVLDTDWVSLEHIRLVNSGGISAPIRIWLDEFANTTAGGTATEGFESFALGSETMFQEPNFSGSTAGNLEPGGTAAVSDSAVFLGAQSNEVNFQFVDDSTARWLRLTTFGAANLPNPAFLAREDGGAPTISFYAMGAVIPEPSTYAAIFGGLALLGAFVYRRRMSVKK